MTAFLVRHLHSVDNLDPANNCVCLTQDELRTGAEAAGLRPEQQFGRLH